MAFSLPSSTFSLCLLLWWQSAGVSLQAQVLSIQQPTLETFRTATVVAIPDGGQAHLGSVSSGQESRFQPGLFPGGNATGRSHTHSTQTAHAVIHDFAEMDSLLLNKPDSARSFPFEESLSESRRRFSPAPQPAPRIPSRFDRLTKTSQSSQSVSRPMDFSVPAHPADKRAARVAERYLQQGKQAQSRGQSQLAQIYYQLAVRNGSVAAAQFLQP